MQEGKSRDEREGKDCQDGEGGGMKMDESNEMIFMDVFSNLRHDLQSVTVDQGRLLGPLCATFRRLLLSYSVRMCYSFHGALDQVRPWVWAWKPRLDS